MALARERSWRAYLPAGRRVEPRTAMSLMLSLSKRLSETALAPPVGRGPSLDRCLPLMLSLSCLPGKELVEGPVEGRAGAC